MRWLRRCGLAEVVRRSQFDPRVFVPNSEMSRMLEREAVPRLVRAETGVADARVSTRHAASAVSRADLALFLDEVRGESEDAAMAVANALLQRGVPTEAIYLDL